MFGIGVQELGLILVIALLVFGPKRMPELARLLGRGMGEFRKASHDLRESLALDEIQNELRDAAGTIKDEAMKPLQAPIKKPAKDPDRPAQAGDDLSPPASVSVGSAAAAGQAGAGEHSDETAPDSGTPSDVSSGTPSGTAPGDPPRTPHPGELPLGNDHEHHPSLFDFEDDEGSEGESSRAAKSESTDASDAKRG